MLEENENIKKRKWDDFICQEVKKGNRCCQYKDCKKRASFNNSGEKKGIFCSTHKEPKMVNVVHKQCAAEGCDLRPNFNHLGETTGMYCTRHKEPEMVDVVNKRCAVGGCNTINPAFNHVGETRGIFCAKHKEPGMVDVKSKRCCAEECNLIPTFNHIGEKRAIFCKTHKKPEMVDVVNPKCAADACNTINPVFNHVGEKRGMFCKTHKEPEMVDVVNPRCAVGECNSLNPVFNHVGKTKGMFCATHKKPGMVDVVSKKCATEGCNLRPNFDYLGETKGIFCFTHKQPGMVDVKHKKCAAEGCETRKGKKPQYEGYCARCFINLFPDKPVSTRFKCRENVVIQFVKTSFPEYTWRCDKRIDCGYSSRRPDALVNFGTHAVVVEVDEDQHKNYDCSCENKRMMEIWRDLQQFESTIDKETGVVTIFREEGEEEIVQRPVVFIRVNPDSYVDHHGVKEKSCWSLHPTTGMWYISAKNQPRWDAKMQFVKETIEYWSANPPPDKLVETIHLFFSPDETTD
jgi:hypothetical protein